MGTFLITLICTDALGLIDPLPAIGRKYRLLVGTGVRVGVAVAVALCCLEVHRLLRHS